jgi:hypothetical protein
VPATYRLRRRHRQLVLCPMMPRGSLLQ